MVHVSVGGVVAMHHPSWLQPWSSGMHCTHPGSGDVAGIMSVTMPLSEWKTLQLLLLTSAEPAEDDLPLYKYCSNPVLLGCLEGERGTCNWTFWEVSWRRTITFFMLAESTIQLFHLVATSVVDLCRVIQSMWISWLKWRTHRSLEEIREPFRVVLDCTKFQ